MKAILLTLCAATAALAQSASIQPGKQPVATTAPAGAYRLCRVSVEGTGQMIVALRGDRVARAHVLPRGGGAAFNADVSGLRVQGDSLQGVVKFETTSGGTDESRGQVATKQIEINVSLRGNTEDEAALRQRNGLGAGHDWAQWYGSAGKFVALPASAPLVDDLAQAWLVWMSEEPTPPGRNQSRRYVDDGGQFDLPSGGGASPVIADGRVYLYYYAPAGEEYDVPTEEIVAKNVKVGVQRSGGMTVFRKEFWKYRSDDVVVCLDAATGQVLWKTAFPQNGYYASDSKPLMAGNTPVVRDGRLYGATGDHLLFCLDAKTGKELWRQPGPRHAERMALLARTLREKKYAGPGAGRNFQCNLAFADGVFLVPTGGQIGPNGYIVNEDPVSGKRFRNGGLWGVDAATGKVLWKRDEKLISVMATPVTWGQYVLVAAQRGLDNNPTILRCLNPKTGADVWTQAIGDNVVTPAVFGDFLIADIGAPPAHQMACFQLTSTGLTKRWEAPASYGFPGGDCLAKVGEHLLAATAGKLLAFDLATGKVVTEEAGHAALLEAIGEHLLIQGDTMHNTTVLDWWTYRAGKFTKRTAGWSPPHLQSGSYETPWVHPLVDGRLFVRGAEGIYCYDLRAK